MPGSPASSAIRARRSARSPRTAAGPRSRARAPRTASPRPARAGPGAGPGRSGARRPRRGIPGQQPVVQRDQRGGRGRAELVAQEGAEPVVGERRLGQVAACGERLHDQPVAGLAVGRGVDERAGRPLGFRGRGPMPVPPSPRPRARAARARAVRGVARRSRGRSARPGAPARRARPCVAPLARRSRGPPARAPTRPLPATPRASSTSTVVPLGSARRTFSRPSMLSGPNTRRTPLRSARSEPSRERGARSGQSASAIASRPMARSRSSTSRANRARVWREGRRSSSRVPSCSTASSPHRRMCGAAVCQRTAWARHRLVESLQRERRRARPTAASRGAPSSIRTTSETST